MCRLWLMGGGSFGFKSCCFPYRNRAKEIFCFRRFGPPAAIFSPSCYIRQAVAIPRNAWNTIVSAMDYALRVQPGFMRQIRAHKISISVHIPKLR